MNDVHIIHHIQNKIGGKPHVCTEECRTQSMNVHIHKKDGLEHIRWSGNNKPWMNKSNFVRALKYVFVCRNTGTVHHCTEECALEPVPNDDHTLACPVSGVQWNNETEVVRSWKLTSKCVPTIVSDKRDPNMYSRTKDGRVLNRTLNIKDESCKRESSSFKARAKPELDHCQAAKCQIAPPYRCLNVPARAWQLAREDCPHVFWSLQSFACSSSAVIHS